MADVFISYKREDRRFAERLSIALEQLGFEVWWDFDLLSGEPYRKVIREVINKSSAALVLWSERSVESDFVLDEATYAKAQKKLCPARIDGVDLPFGFGSLHTDDLHDWEGDFSHPGFQAIVRAVEAKVGRKGQLGARQQSQSSVELEAFKAAQIAGSAASLNAYLRQFSDGMFARFVRAQLETMQVEAAAARSMRAEEPPIADAPDARFVQRAQSTYAAPPSDESDIPDKNKAPPVALFLALALVIGGGVGAWLWKPWETQAPLPAETAAEEASIYAATPAPPPAAPRARTQPSARDDGSSVSTPDAVLEARENGVAARDASAAGATPQSVQPTNAAGAFSPDFLHADIARAVANARLARERAEAALAQALLGNGHIRTVDGYAGGQVRISGQAATGSRSFYAVEETISGTGAGAKYLGQRNQVGPHGDGVYLFANGGRYEGQWTNSRRHGYGVMWDSQGRVVQQGMWRNDRLITPLSAASD